MEELKHTEAKNLIKEFNQKHTDYTIKYWGKWRKNWKKEIGDVDLKNGCWYYKGYNLHDLYLKYGE